MSGRGQAASAQCCCSGMQTLRPLALPALRHLHAAGACGREDTHLSRRRLRVRVRVQGVGFAGGAEGGGAWPVMTLR